MNKTKAALFFLISSLSWFYQATANEIDLTEYSHSLLHVGAGQPSIAVCDFNTDGDLDVIFANYSDNNIIAFKGNGKGDLQESGGFLLVKIQQVLMWQISTMMAMSILPSLTMKHLM